MTRLGFAAPAVDNRALAPEIPKPREALAAFRYRADVNYERSLSSLIESEIIPRLVVAHSCDRSPAAELSATGTEIEPGDIEALVPLSLEVEADTLLAHVEAILARGVGIDAVMVDLLAPAARLLGEYWESDRCDFLDVTMGLWRLQEVVHEIAGRVPVDRLQSAGGQRALFASMPGDQHSFGTVVIDEMFRRDGWITERMCEAEMPELLKRVSSDWFDLVGLTVSCDCHIENLTSVIVALRNVSKNSRTAILVGGRIFTNDPTLAERVGADGTAANAKLALRVAEVLVRDREREAVLVS